MRTGAAAALLLLIACTDPRERPVAPAVQVNFAPSFRLKSPGSITASLHLFDEDGLKSLQLSVASSDSALTGDSTVFFTGESELFRPVNWTVPSGIPIGTSVTLIARVLDFKGFVAADTTHLSVQDTI